MKCTDIEQFADAYLDHEFGERERLEFEIHLEGCDACRREIAIQRGMRSALVEACAVSAPVHLHASITDLLGLDEPDEEEPAAHAVRTPLPIAAAQPGWREWTGWRYVSLAAAATLLTGLTALGLSTSPATPAAAESGRYLGSLHSTVDQTRETPATEEIVRESLDWHRRQLPMEVTGPSTDQVRGWFQNKVDFPVRLPDFRDARVSVLGARLAKVGDRNAALVTLEVDHRKLSMMVFPTPPTRAHLRAVRRTELAAHPRMQLQSNNGYNVAIIRDGDMAYTFVSDLPRPTLKRLVTRAQIR